METIDVTREATEKLKRLRQAYHNDLPNKIAMLGALWKRVKKQADHATLNELYIQIHSLVASTASYGYDRLSVEANHLQTALQTMLKQMPVDPALWAPLIEAHLSTIALLSRESRKPPLREGLARACHPETTEPNNAQRGDVLLLEADDAMATDAAFQLNQFGYRVDRISKPDELSDCVQRKSYSVVIIDIMLPGGGEEGIDGVNWLGNLTLTLPPIIFISTRRDIRTRLMAVRGGGTAYFTRPLNIPALAEKLDELTSAEVAEPYRILIVDDEELMAEHTATVLQQAGMLTEIVLDPCTVQVILEQFSPELILMEVNLAGCGGLELAQAIRQQEAYIGTPIVFYSTASSIDLQLDAMRKGVDDFMEKPVKADYLVTKIQTRVSRARKIMSLMMRDSLTGLFNHTSLKEYLLREHAQAVRYDTPLAYALLDLDAFKAVNDTYGHSAGDQVLKSLAQLLRQRVRRSDIVGRYGGEEFAIIFPGVDEDGAANILDEIRQAFSHIEFVANNERFKVTLSAGVADRQQNPEVADLFEFTDRALYAAKEQGRNRIVKASAL